MSGHTNYATFERQTLRAMAGDGVDTRNAGAVRAWLRRADRQWVFCAEPVGEVVLKPPAPRQEGAPVRPVRLRPELELAAMARASVTLAGLRELADWAERHRPVFAQGRPEPAAARAAARELAVFDGAAHEDAHAPERLRVWNTAFDAGLLTLRSGRARRVAGCDGPDPDPLVLRRWLAVYVAITEFGEYCARTDHDGYHIAERVLGELMFELYQSDCAVPGHGEVARLATGIIADATADGILFADQGVRLRAFAEAAVHTALAQLARHGAVTARPGGDVEISALGRWGLNRLLNAAGLRAPVLGGYTHASADELLAVLPGYCESERAVELLGWLGARTANGAAAELLAAASRADVGRRGMAVAILKRIGPDAEPAVRAGLADPRMWRHCRQWLDEHALDPGPDLTDTDRAWLLVESVVGLSHQRGLQDYVRLLGRLVGERETPLVALLAGLAHPDRDRALDLLFELHPDPHVSVAARYRSAEPAGRRRP